MKVEKKQWRDETGGTSKIDGLNFSADRVRESCTVRIEGTGHSIFGNACQKFKVYFNGEKIYDNELKGVQTITKKISGYQNFTVTGEMSISGMGTAIGNVSVECTYDESSVLKSQSVSWKDTAIMSEIEKLFLPAEQNWKRCEIKIEGEKNLSTGYHVQLIVDGQLASQNTHEGTLNGTESVVFAYDINRKATLLVSGYISTGGAKVTLTGLY